MTRRNSLEGSNVLVTGAAGFIGGHLVEALLDEGARVTALVHYSSGPNRGALCELDDERLHRLRVIAGDVTDPESVRTAVEGNEVVFHLAALIGIPYSYQAPRSYLHTNVEGTFNVLEAVRACGTDRLIITSTSEVYGSAVSVPIDEHHPLQAQSPYAATKIAADKMAESYYRSFDVPVVVLRPFNTYGPRQSPRAVIPATIRQALWCGTVRLGATETVRDMTYVTDTVAGFVCAAKTPGIEGGVFNLGTGTGHTIGRIADLILKLVGRSDAIESDPDRMRPAASEVDRLISSHDSFTGVSGWHPRVELEQGLRRTIDWIRSHDSRGDTGSYAI